MLLPCSGVSTRTESRLSRSAGGGKHSSKMAEEAGFQELKGLVVAGGRACGSRVVLIGNASFFEAIPPWLLFFLGIVSTYDKRQNNDNWFFIVGKSKRRKLTLRYSLPARRKSL